MLNTSINELTKRCEALLRENRYSESRIRTYRMLWAKGILPYMRERGLTLYDASIGEQFYDEYLGGRVAEFADYEMKRSILILNDTLGDGVIKRKHLARKVQPKFDGPLGEEVLAFLEERKDRRIKSYKVESYGEYLYYFCTFLESKGLVNYGELTASCLEEFLETVDRNKHAISCNIRTFLNWLFSEGKIRNRFSSTLSKYIRPSREIIPSWYDANEVRKVGETIQRTSAVGKRDYAIFSLAALQGYRSCDIANLKFSDIDWVKGKITFDQVKTGNTVSLPLLTEVGNAIIDYLRNGRPASDSPYVFLQARAPFCPITSSAISCALSRVFSAAGLNISGRRHGIHCLRFSLATRMLENGEPLPVITGVLGHSSSVSTNRYLKVDLQKLLICALEVPPVPDSFYLQKGGLFYE